MKPMTVSTAGSAATMLTICSRILSMAWNEVSWSAMNLAAHASVVLLRKESLGHADEQVHVQADGGQQNEQGDERNGGARSESVLPYRSTIQLKTLSLVR